MENKRKPLKDLNLLDRFLFAEAMEDPVIMQNLLEILLGEDIVLKYPPQTEKERRTSPLKRFIKLDVWAWDTQDIVYDTEVQQEDTKNLPKRSRLYQALIDVKLLSPGDVDFNKLNKVYIIIITPFDLFGHNLYQYTFENQCKEISSLSLQDDATRIFFNTHGKNDNDVRPELIELLRFMEHTTEDISNHCKSEKIKDMQKRITAIKSSEEIGVKYMQAWEERIIENRKARESGLAEGLAQGQNKLNLLYSKLIENDRMPDLIKATQDSDFLNELYKEFNIP